MDDGHDVGVGYCDEGYEAEDGGRDGDEVEPVEWSSDWWVWAGGEMAGEPAADGFGVLGSVIVSFAAPVVVR